LVISHPARDVQTEKVAEVARRYNASVVTGQTRRSVDEVTAFFGDWEILEPGVTQTPAWRPDPPAPVTGTVPMWAGVARKP
jgi:S-adenosyl methyltransferase